MTHYDIVITSDIVCPWCLIGHKRLSRAIENHKKTYPSDTFKLKYLPFYLDPPPRLASSSSAGQEQPAAFPVESVDRKQRYEAKFGAARMNQMFAMLSKVGEQEGIDFKYGGRTGRSRNGHRLVYYAQNRGGQDSQDKVMMALWRRYFELEVDITQLEVLVEVGVEAGLGPADEIREYLLSGRDMVEVDTIAEQQSMEGVSGVPHYVIQDTWGVGGAQEPKAFETLFVRWKDMEKKGQVDSRPVNGSVASVSGKLC